MIDSETDHDDTSSTHPRPPETSTIDSSAPAETDSNRQSIVDLSNDEGGLTGDETASPTTAETPDDRGSVGLNGTSEETTTRRNDDDAAEPNDPSSKEEPTNSTPTTAGATADGVRRRHPHLSDIDEPSLGLTTAIVVLAALLILFAINHLPEPRPNSDAPEYVASFFEEIRAGNVEGALTMMGAAPSGEAARFLRPDAIGDDWSIESIEEIEYVEYYSGPKATVGFDMVSGGTTVHSTIQLTKKDDEAPWEMNLELASVVLQRPYFDHIEVNGVIAPIDRTPNMDVRLTEYRLLPGVYHLYGSHRDLYNLDGDTIMIVPGDNQIPHEFSLTLTEKGEEHLQNAVNDYVDTCVEIGRPAQLGCPFGAAYLDDPRDNQYYLDIVYDVGWEIIEYPIVTGVPQYSTIAVIPRQLGTATITATGIESAKRPGAPVDVTIDCAIDPVYLIAWFSVDGRIIVSPDIASADVPETCGE